jgi:hypothetical protein
MSATSWHADQNPRREPGGSHDVAATCFYALGFRKQKSPLAHGAAGFLNN